MDATAIAPQSNLAAPAPARGFEGLGGDSFFQLLIAQLANQDPLEPASNQELLQQISSIRDIELSTALTGSLRSLVDQQRVGSGAALIGQYVSGSVTSGDAGTLPVSGVVVGMRFSPDGSPVLLLSGGGELPMDQVTSVMPPAQAARSLVGQAVIGVEESASGTPEFREGIVTAVRTEVGGGLILELDTGDALALDGVISAVPQGSAGAAGVADSEEE